MQAQAKITQFRGVTSLSSNQYFGRPEDDAKEGASCKLWVMHACVLTLRVVLDDDAGDLAVKLALAAKDDIQELKKKATFLAKKGLEFAQSFLSE